MIIQCPACATQYEVPGSAIGPEGRKVRCANCRHGWVVGSPNEQDTAPEEDVAVADQEEEPTAPIIPQPHERAAPPAAARRRPLWVWLAIILAVMIGAAALAISSWGMPGWVPGPVPTFAAAPTDLVLDFPRDQQGRRQLPNGTEIFGASGTITNSGDTPREVPPILIVLRDARERIVYSWVVEPPERSLAPGQSVVVNEAVTDAPRSAHFADIGWNPG